MDISNEIKIMLWAAAPVVELRYAVPYGILRLETHWLTTYLFAIIGNMLPVIPILLFLKPVSERLRKFRLWDKFFKWLFDRAKRKGALVEKYEALGLILFVAIPLPVTGAWTGSVVASLFKIRLRYAFISILLGVAIAGTIMTILSISGRIAYENSVPWILKLFNKFS
ncbi:MAG: small multi-drug export protein [Candidatus Omnitrophica bacterium]|nr:small multi-drug export protein [Candidatus Omnitrophota bacterium]